MRAKLYLLNNNLDLAKSALQEAIQLGIDSNRINNDVKVKGLINPLKN